MTSFESARVVARETFTLQRPNGLAVRGTVLRPPRASGAVILCHGFKGFSRWAFFPVVAQSIADAGLNAISFDFSGSGVGADGESFTELEAFASNTYARELADLDAVERHGRERGWIGDRLGLFGHSRGGASAIFRASRAPGIDALVTWASIATVCRWSDGERDAWRHRGYAEITNSRTGQVMRLGTELLDECDRDSAGPLNLVANAPNVVAPWLIVHGTADETVSVDDALLLHRAARAGAELRLVQGANHAFNVQHPLSVISPALDEALDATVDFLETHLT